MCKTMHSHKNGATISFICVALQLNPLELQPWLCGNLRASINHQVETQGTFPSLLFLNKFHNIIGAHYLWHPLKILFNEVVRPTHFENAMWLHHKIGGIFIFLMYNALKEKWPLLRWNWVWTCKIAHDN
jgi:hypothetical protein